MRLITGNIRNLMRLIYFNAVFYVSYMLFIYCTRVNIGLCIIYIYILYFIHFKVPALVRLTFLEVNFSLNMMSILVYMYELQRHQRHEQCTKIYESSVKTNSK